MSTLIGSPSTVQELIDLLGTLPPEKPVRVSTGYHDFIPDVREHERCITIEPLSDTQKSVLSIMADKLDQKELGGYADEMRAADAFIEAVRPVLARIGDCSESFGSCPFDPSWDEAMDALDAYDGRSREL